MKIFDLIPKNRKSFNNKAKVIEQDNTAKLLSFETIVAEINTDTKEYIQHGEYSQTTNRHIQAFKEFYDIISI